MTTLVTIPPKGNPTPAAPPGRGWLVGFLSASNFPRYELLRTQTDKNEAFLRSCLAVRELFRRLGTPPDRCLDLTNFPGGPLDLLSRVEEFISERSEVAARRGEPLTDFVFYYVGHGEGEQRDYSLLLRNSERGKRDLTALRFATLVNNVKRFCDAARERTGYELRQFYILDACFAGRAKFATECSTGVKLPVRGGPDYQPARGIGVLCSCSESEESVAPAGLEHTLFTTALLAALDAPAEDRELMRTWYGEEPLSLNQLERIVNRWLWVKTGPQQNAPPAAEAHCLDAIAGDVQEVPLFPNPFRPAGTNGPEAALPPLARVGGRVEAPTGLEAAEPPPGPLVVLAADHGVGSPAPPEPPAPEPPAVAPPAAERPRFRSEALEIPAPVRAPIGPLLPEAAEPPPRPPVVLETDHDLGPPAPPEPPAPPTPRIRKGPLGTPAPVGAPRPRGPSRRLSVSFLWATAAASLWATATASLWAAFAAGKVAVPAALLSTLVLTAFAGAGLALAWYRSPLGPRIAPREYRILLYGHPGSGKSSFIEHAMGLEREIESTTNFDMYRGRVPLSLRRAAGGGWGSSVIVTDGVDVVFADYCGQDPGQLIVDRDPQFFGEPGYRQVDAILFLVDFLPALMDEQTGRVYNDEEVLREVSASAEAAIRKRRAALAVPDQVHHQVRVRH